MSRVRIAGPRPRLESTLQALQDFGALHVDRPRVPGAAAVDTAVLRARRHIERCLADVEAALTSLDVPPGEAAATAPPTAAGAAARHARRLRREAERLARQAAALEQERAHLLRYSEFVSAFEALAGHELTWPDRQAFYVVLRAGAADALAELQRALDAAMPGHTEVLHQELPDGEWAVLILATAHAAPRVAALLSASRVEELPPPTGIAETSLLRARPAIEVRLAAVHEALSAVGRARAARAEADGGWLMALRAFLRDELLRLDARSRVFAADFLFIVEGWLPATTLADLRRHLQAAVGTDVMVTTVPGRGWIVDAAPVTLHNPPLFAPFEVLTRLVPLPRYGTIDPTPFVAVFVPAFFGVMVGDLGYGFMLAALALFLRVRSAPGTTKRAVSTVAFACSSSTIVFGLVFGELFGTLGPLVGLRPIFNREEATIPFLALSLALGGVHVTLALVLATVTSWRGGRRREAAGRGVALGMLALTFLALLAVLEVLPGRLFTPLAVALLLAFVLLVVLEGLIGVLELLSTFGHILSYARIMALGTASLMLAIVANRMTGALGSALVGVLFALLFHLVNFALALFSPTIHALRLHYVEFFGHFFTPGGPEYRPFAHWHPSP